MSIAQNVTATFDALPPPKMCVVPKLKGKKLKVAKKALLKADCQLGKVKVHKSKSAKVKKQSAKPVAMLPLGAKVNVKLGRSAPRR